MLVRVNGDTKCLLRLQRNISFSCSASACHNMTGTCCTGSFELHQRICFGCRYVNCFIGVDLFFQAQYATKMGRFNQVRNVTNKLLSGYPFFIFACQGLCNTLSLHSSVNAECGSSLIPYHVCRSNDACCLPVATFLWGYLLHWLVFY